MGEDDLMTMVGTEQARDREDARYSPLISIVMATYNAANALELTLKSILNQRFTQYELIIIDGGSKDSTLEMIHSIDRRSVYWVSEPDQGIYDAFNKASRVVKGEWVIFLGAGDQLHDDMALSDFAAFVENLNEQIELVYGKVEVANPRNNLEVQNQPWAEMKGRWRGGRPMIPHHQGVFHRRRLLSGENPFDLKYHLAADSKVVYRSMQRVDPVFMDRIVAIAPEGGASTHFRYYIKSATEIIRVNQELKHGHYFRQGVFYLKILGTYLAYRVGGEKLAQLSIAIYRKLSGRKPSVTGV